MTDGKTSFDAAIYGLPSGSTPDLAQGREPLEVLASQFVAALREGKQPRVGDYAAGHPELAAEIERLFPLLLAMEDWKVYRDRTTFEHRSLTTLPNERFGEFRIIREIGRGGMGIVFEAQEQSSGRHVGIKVLPFLDSKIRRERFEREARMAARLRHPHIVPVFSFGEHDNLSYYVMKLIRGVGLDWVIERLSSKESVVHAKDIATRFGNLAGPVGQPNAAIDQAESRGEASLPFEATDLSSAPPSKVFAAGLNRNSWLEIARIGAQVADALHYAHSQGTVHRDIKPANLLLDANGDVWVTDFGLAESLDRLLEPESSAAAGTLRYLAPEQFHGQFDVRSDIYSLGITLFELLTRRPAFEAGDRRFLIDAILDSPLPNPRQLNPKIPRDLDAIVRKATARNAAQRYQSALDLWTELLRFLKGQRVRARGAIGWFKLPR